MINGVVDNKDLQRMSGYSRNHDIEIWLKRHGVSYLVGKDGLISTTITAFDGITKKSATKVSF